MKKKFICILLSTMMVFSTSNIIFANDTGIEVNNINVQNIKEKVNELEEKYGIELQMSEGNNSEYVDANNLDELETYLSGMAEVYNEIGSIPKEQEISISGSDLNPFLRADSTNTYTYENFTYWNSEPVGLAPFFSNFFTKQDTKSIKSRDKS